MPAVTSQNFGMLCLCVSCLFQHVFQYYCLKSRHHNTVKLHQAVPNNAMLCRVRMSKGIGASQPSCVAACHMVVERDACLCKSANSAVQDKEVGHVTPPRPPA